MTPIDFKEATGTLTAGENPNCKDLRVFKDGKIIISKWKMSWRERVKALFTGTVWFTIRAENTHAPISIGLEYLFEKNAPNDAPGHHLEELPEGLTE